MRLLGWSIWCVFLTLHMSACDLEIYDYDSHEVICSQGLSECIVKDVIPFGEEATDAVAIQTLTPYVKLCCNDTAVLCTLCLVIDTEISIDLDKDTEDEGHSGSDEETENPKGSVTVCYNVPQVLPTCKKVDFTIDPTALSHKKQTKMSIVIFKPNGVSFSSKVYVKSKHLLQHVDAPTLTKVCHQELQERVENCRAPRLNTVINKETNNVELKFAESSKRPSLCVQYETNGTCQRWNMSIALHSVVPCMCFQVWYEDDEKPARSISCPFMKSDDFQSNIWQNVSLSVDQGQMNSYGTMLLWNLSAPCRLEGEVWPCHNENSCKEIQGFRQQLTEGKWKQNNKGLWENKGVFEDINLQLSPCVMVTAEGRELGPFCFHNTERWRWSLLVVSVLLLICLTVLLFYFLHDYIKKWAASWSHCVFVKIAIKGHVVLLSPPDVDDGVSQLVCKLGSQLSNLGFSVSVDQWSRRGQCTLGPQPWLHSQLLELNSRVVLVLTRSALERTEEWAHQNKDIIKTKREDKGLAPIWSPYSDVFTTALWILQADKQLGRAKERFLLVKFDSHLSSDRNLPKLLQGLPLFQHPSQTQGLLAELTVGGRQRRSNVSRSTGGRMWTGWKWGISDRWRVKTKEGPDQQKEQFKYPEAEINMETKFLQHP